MKPKRKQGKKIGTLARISNDAHKFLAETGARSIREALDQVLLEMIDLKTYLEHMSKSKSWVILPESKVVCTSIAEARGEAILRAVKARRKQPEEPVIVRAVV